MSKDQIISTLKKDMPYIRSQYGVKRIGLFGSFVRDEQNDASDVDILAEFERPIGIKFVEFADYLEGLLGRRADILTLAGLSSIRNQSIADKIKNSIFYV